MVIGFIVIGLFFLATWIVVELKFKEIDNDIASVRSLIWNHTTELVKMGNNRDLINATKRTLSDIIDNSKYLERLAHKNEIVIHQLLELNGLELDEEPFRLVEKED